MSILANGSPPLDWRIRRIKDIADLRSGDFISAEDIAPQGDFPVYGGNGLRGHTTAYTHDGFFALIGRQGALCGNINYANGKFWATEHAVVASLRKDYATKWFGELLSAMNLNQHSNAAAQPGLSVETIKFLHLPVPPAVEQHRIAAYLDASCRLIDAAVAAKRKQYEVLEQTHAAAVHCAVTAGLNADVAMKASDVSWLGDVPAHWEASRIRNLVDLSPGAAGDAPVAGEVFAVVPMECVSELGGVEFSELRTLDNVGAGMTMFQTGDVIFAKITPCMENGKGALVPEMPTRAAFGSTEFHVLRPGYRIDGRFLYYFTWNPIFRAFAAENMVGAAGQKRVSSRFLRDTRIFLPQMQEQLAIADYLDAHRANFLALRKSLEEQLQVLTAYRKSLIHECVTGQRRITDEDVQRVSAHAASTFA